MRDQHRRTRPATTRRPQRPLRSGRRPTLPLSGHPARHRRDPTTATLHGIAANPALTDATVRFEYGTTTNYGHTTTPQPLNALTSNQPFTAELADLDPATTHHYRAIVENSAGTAQGPDQTFTTLPPPPPQCADTTAHTPFQTPVDVTLDCTGTDATIEIVTPPGNGTLATIDQTARTVTYTPAPGFAGTDTFTYRATNPGGESTIAQATITVDGPPPPPPSPPNGDVTPPSGTQTNTDQGQSSATPTTGDQPPPAPPRPRAHASALTTITTKTTTLTNNGTLPITVRCTATATPTCPTTITLTTGIQTKGRTRPRTRPLILARRKITLRANTTRTIRVRLTPQGRRLRTRTRTKARIIARTTQPATAARDTLTRTRRITILNPHAARQRPRTPTFTG